MGMAATKTKSSAGKQSTSLKKDVALFALTDKRNAPMLLGNAASRFVLNSCAKRSALPGFTPSCACVGELAGILVSGASSYSECFRVF
jgi:hypothetical protein